MQYDAVLFDFDGVLVEGPSMDRFSDAVRRAYDAQPVEFGRSGPVAETLGALLEGDFESITRRCRSLGIETEAFCARAARELVRTQLEAVERGLRSAYDDVVAVRSIGRPLGIVSDNHPSVVSTLLDRFGFESLFETVHGCPLTPDGLARRKPDPRNIRAAMAALDAESALYVGDRSVDVRAARNAGIDAAHLQRDGTAPETDVEATYRLTSLAELPAVVE
ncbi:HAD family hydrolase [Halosolutus gelatinilyticus]|uniref:HAD family hydrolase n=1 Tax=Halosolutus gelatinilyticus TaxID=2931975 RepID=UPI001FF51635|nr:HAD family hydrolase [Halosolutus gelatinilyticus]